MENDELQNTSECRGLGAWDTCGSCIVKTAALAVRERGALSHQVFSGHLVSVSCFVIYTEGKQAQTGQATGPGSHSAFPAPGVKVPGLSRRQDEGSLLLLPTRALPPAFSLASLPDLEGLFSLM